MERGARPAYGSASNECKPERPRFDLGAILMLVRVIAINLKDWGKGEWKHHGSRHGRKELRAVGFLERHSSEIDQIIIATLVEMIYVDNIRQHRNVKCTDHTRVHFLLREILSVPELRLLEIIPTQAHSSHCVTSYCNLHHHSPHLNVNLSLFIYLKCINLKAFSLEQLPHIIVWIWTKKGRLGDL